MKRIFIVVLSTFSAVINSFGQTENSKKRTRSIYSNWMSIEYLKCLKSDLPCECEKPKENFLVSLDTTRKFVLLYDGRTNYDYNLYQFKAISPTNLELFSEHHSPTLFENTTTVIGQIKVKNDTLLFIEINGKQTKSILYSTGDNDSYFKEHIKLLNSAMAIRGYDNLNKTLKSDSLKCWCNWELDGGINIVFGSEKDWILEKQENELYIYEWTNPPSVKTKDLKIEKKLLKKLKW